MYLSVYPPFAQFRAVLGVNINSQTEQLGTDLRPGLVGTEFGTVGGQMPT